MSNRYSYSLDKVEFIGGFDTREAAIAEGTEVARGRVAFWTGESVRPPKSDFVPSATMLAEMITQEHYLPALVASEE